MQNAVNQAITRLPQEVQQQGIAVTKSQGDSLMVVALYDQSRSLTSLDISDFLVSSLQEPLSRVEGVGETTVFGAPVCNAHLAQSAAADQLRSDALRRAGRHRGAEFAGHQR
ncbi:putative rnd superfamily protein [Klebsiella michiganensis]|uniref:Putative rnd superfamily protein n=1 Tax=Klebsiella michiganensis TaxID=1134687 RepID=A0A7H4MZM7_9ENTR|nr:putative rnd superfamily protein [Klebsiella michiganensis]